MNKLLYVSTSSFQAKDLNNILEICKENGLRNIELSTCSYHNQKPYTTLIKLYEKDSFHFLLHNYFPPPLEPFVLNIASNYPQISELSRQHCLDAINLAAQLEAPFYSVHAGFCFHAKPEHLGKKIDRVITFPRKTAQKIFIESVQYLADYALKHNMVLAIENNVLAPFNLKDGKNEHLLGVTSEDILDIIESVQRENVMALIDVGHLKVSAQTLGFSPNAFIRDLSPHTVALHLSDNNGVMDEHKSIWENSWFWHTLSAEISRDVFWILEVTSCSISQIIEQIALIDTHLKSSIGTES